MRPSCTKPAEPAEPALFRACLSVLSPLSFSLSLCVHLTALFSLFSLSPSFSVRTVRRRRGLRRRSRCVQSGVLRRTFRGHVDDCGPPRARPRPRTMRALMYSSPWTTHPRDGAHGPCPIQPPPPPPPPRRSLPVEAERAVQARGGHILGVRAKCHSGDGARRVGQVHELVPLLHNVHAEGGTTRPTTRPDIA